MAGSKFEIILDWDGTMVPARWPEQVREWCPGAVAQVKRLHETGMFRFLVDSARLNPHEYRTGYTVTRDPSIVASEVQYIRSMLDSEGLTFVDIYTKHGKPSGDVYVDDKGERYQGHAKSWEKLADKIILRFSKETA